MVSAEAERIGLECDPDDISLSSFLCPAPGFNLRLRAERPAWPPEESTRDERFSRIVRLRASTFTSIRQIEVRHYSQRGRR